MFLGDITPGYSQIVQLGTNLHFGKQSPIQTNTVTSFFFRLEHPVGKKFCLRSKLSFRRRNGRSFVAGNLKHQLVDSTVGRRLITRDCSTPGLVSSPRSLPVSLAVLRFYCLYAPEFELVKNIIQTYVFV